MKIKKIYDAYIKARDEQTKLDELVMNGAFDLEAEWDAAYETYWNLREALIAELQDLTGATRTTCNAMIASDKLAEIMSRIAA